jgi:hypothetical protein
MTRLSLVAALLVAATPFVSTGCAMPSEAESDQAALSAVSPRRGGICDGASLQAALDQAGPGDTVTVGACAVSGAFTVPPGVTLSGRNPAVSRVVASGDDIGVTVFAGAEPATVRRLSIESSALAGIFVASDANDGTGRARIERVRIDADRGVGIAAESIGGLALSAVRLTGPVTASNAASVDHDATPFDTATHGLVTTDVADLSLGRVRTDGFAQFGALLVRSSTRWARGGAKGNVGTGVAIFGGTAHLERLSLTGTFRGIRPAEDVAAGGAFLEGAEVESDRVRVTRNDGWGLFHDGAGTSSHTKLFASANEHAGVWAQGSDVVTFDRSFFYANAYAGIVAVDSERLVVNRSQVLFSQEATPTGFPTAGDGIQAVSTFAELDNVFLGLNERIGLLSWVEGVSPCLTPEEHLTVANVRVLGLGDAAGAIFQRGLEDIRLVPGVQRLGGSGDIDDQLVDNLGFFDVAEGVSPCLLPQGELVATDGISSLFTTPGDPDPNL